MQFQIVIVFRPPHPWQHPCAYLFMPRGCIRFTAAACQMAEPKTASIIISGSQALRPRLSSTELPLMSLEGRRWFFNPADPRPTRNSDNGLALNDFLPAILPLPRRRGKVKIANYNRANKAGDIDLGGTLGNYQRNEPGFPLNQIEFSALMADDVLRGRTFFSSGISKKLSWQIDTISLAFVACQHGKTPTTFYAIN